MAEENLDNETVYLVSGKKLKELLKKGKTKGVQGEILVQERGKDLFIGFAATVTIAAVSADGVAGFYRVPAQIDAEAGSAEDAKKKIKDALGIVDGEGIQVWSVLANGGSMVAEIITVQGSQSS